MKVLYAIPELVQGGAERYIVETIRRLHPTRVEASIATFRARVDHYGDLVPRDVPLHALGVDGAGWDAITRFRALLDREKPDLIHSFMEAPNFVARVAAALRGGPPVVTQVCGTMMAPRYLAVERILSGLGPRRAGNESATTVLANSGVIVRELTRYGRVPPERITVMPNFVDVERFRPPSNAERADAKTQFGVESQSPVIVFPAWQGLAKGHVTFLYALARARREGALPNAVVLFAGRVRDKLAGNVIPRVILRLGLGDIVRPLGAVSDMPTLLAAADWAVLPSWWEGGAPPMAVIEALASGVPTVVSRAADGDERLSEAGVGLVVPTFRVRPLAAALRQASEMDEAKRAELGARGRAWALANASPEVVLEKLVGVYRAAVGFARIESSPTNLDLDLNLDLDQGRNGPGPSPGRSPGPGSGTVAGRG